MQAAAEQLVQSGFEGPANFLNLPYRIEDMLAEARGFRVGLTLAHQNLAQLPVELRKGINTNARNKIMFR